MTETLPNDQLYEADYSILKPLYEAPAHPGSVLRRPIDKNELADSVDSDKQFAELLIDLEERYGISSPNMSLAQTTNAQGRPNVLIKGQWVEGKNLSDEAAEIPRPVVRHAIESIIDYYSEAIKKGGPCLSDLRPSNIIYGRTAGDTDDKLYFIDIEPLWSKNDAGKPLNRYHMDRILPELWLLIHEGLTNGEDWQDLSEALAKLYDLQ